MNKIVVQHLSGIAGVINGACDRRCVPVLLCVVVLGMQGCDGIKTEIVFEETTTVVVDEPDEADQDKTEVEVVQTPDDQPLSDVELAVTRQVERQIAEPLRNSPHPIAERSAFPEQGETFDELIPAKKLSDLDQFTVEIDPDDIPAVVPWDRASQYVSYEITVEGKVVNVGQSNDGKVNFLNFDRNWRGKFYMVVFDDLAETLDQPVKKLFEGKTVRVKGTVELHRNNPQMKIESMDRVEFIEP